ncbi:unnamed protein product [Rotaria sordida]|uniref:Roquin II domain-containing protein n=1 Tax=Rotaria sordida TaxID=392033 RepID=A0A815TXT0_9BILA|nr:unnamed protein product [Rotaria sordida]CAF1508229.1 unnamed protein product [Rotaria sordida]
MKLDNETKSCFNYAELAFGDISLISKPISSSIKEKQWSSLLYGTTQHELSMQLIIDELSKPDSFSKAFPKFANVLRNAGYEPENLLYLEEYFQFLSKINLENNAQ